MLYEYNQSVVRVQKNLSQGEMAERSKALAC